MYMTAVNLGNRFLSETGSWMLAFRYKQYGQPTIATAGLLVTIIIIIIIIIIVCKASTTNATNATCWQELFESV